MALSQSIAYDKTFIHEKTKVIGLKRHTAGSLLVQKDSQFHAGGPSAYQVPNQELTRQPRLNQRFHQQDIPALNVKFWAEENLSGGGVGFLGFSLHELANHVQIQL